ncbi:hypothetical protein [Aliiglaciecola sp. NS0011-25]|uniref:AbiJ-NTD4 domain-containing protein n=1 Tax=Aliiglaciecola sp. NS0011-25 TaxID=3127654 RepID=UPI00310A1DA7
MLFSQRIGINPAEKVIQIDSIDEDLRNGLWNALSLFYWENYESPGDSFYGRSDYVRNSNHEDLVLALWIHYFKKPIDSIDDYWESCLQNLRKYFFRAEWWEVYEFVEFVTHNGAEAHKGKFIEACNFNLERENSAYRFVDGKLAKITSKEEINSIETAIREATPYGGVKDHLKRALSLHSDKLNPDYRNSIKESISAVESLAKQVSGDEKATLGAVLKKLEREAKMHPALKSAFSSLYGYTNDADGIRHALLEEETLTKTDARFMLICCSAFVNYVIETIG